MRNPFRNRQSVAPLPAGISADLPMASVLTQRQINATNNQLHEDIRLRNRDTEFDNIRFNGLGPPNLTDQRRVQLLREHIRGYNRHDSSLPISRQQFDEMDARITADYASARNRKLRSEDLNEDDRKAMRNLTGFEETALVAETEHAPRMNDDEVATANFLEREGGRFRQDRVSDSRLAGRSAIPIINAREV